MALLVLFSPFAVAAQQSADAQMKQELDAIYQRLLEDPADIALNRRMIEVALELKDYDAAIGAVERLIFYDPGNPQLQLEAARLYFQIESYAAAQGYLKEALALPAATGPVRAEIEALIAQIDDATQPSVWSGLTQVGIRYQSNANIGPYFLGENEPLQVEGPQSDWNYFLLGTLAYTNQISDNVILEGAISGYYADQLDIDRLDLGFADLIVGPRYVTDDGKLSIKSYANIQGILLGAEPYQAAAGGGLLVRLTSENGTWIEPGFDYKHRFYNDTDDYPNATDQSGDLRSYVLRAGGEISQDVSWTGRIGFNDNGANAAYQSYDKYLIDLSLRVALNAAGLEDWSITPFAGVSWTDFKGIAPTESDFGLTTIREDFQWNVGASFEIPLGENASLGGQLQYIKNESNLDRYTYENILAIIGPVGRF